MSGNLSEAKSSSHLQIVPQIILLIEIIATIFRPKVAFKFRVLWKIFDSTVLDKV